ncbi:MULTISPECIES: TolC family protein [Brevibacillus]|jgi:outer membrane protein TolC|uniref:Outer membrane protein n=1 Tax=Brevibacillus borstelensis AK1 TaxID=1300222 RepID=M8DIL3_9BACL|nr:TolC family protein [Brevibacillus borstelensis]EMT53272.1 hypothetical protein I532_10852 [Brevibacillus borstelensis AK1]KKX55345.1 hypothetical protein X546_06530 [Brevibacillus borstelensis cifa_chp40]MBE5394801.1 TolC family protein [Brevibacillus borstelensis]MCC0566118.1 TolC family protein [Brevibacillus borstelensis]MCM3472888.1 TolC family protein [Brevibacillus borstelensis]
MKSTVIKRLYSTTLITAFLSGSHIALGVPFAAHAEQASADKAALSEVKQTDAAPSTVNQAKQAEAAAFTRNQTEQAKAAALTLAQAEDIALNNSIDLAMLRLDADSTYYKTRQTLQEKGAIKSGSIKTLDQAKKKYEEMAKARKDLVHSQAAMKAQENTLRLQVQKAYLDALFGKAQLDLQKKSIKRQFWSSAPSEETQKNIENLETNHKQALAKLNELLNENPSKEWKLEAADDLTNDKLPVLEEIQKAAYEKRPDIVKAIAEKTFAQEKIDYLKDYSALSTYLGKMARNDGKKAELLLQRAKAKADQEIAESYKKAVAARQAMEESAESRKSAEKRYRAVLSNYHNGKAALSELAQQESELLELETRHVESIYQYNTAVATLKHSIGYSSY